MSFYRNFFTKCEAFFYRFWAAMKITLNMFLVVPVGKRVVKL